MKEAQDTQLLPIEVGTILGVRIIESPYVPPPKTLVRKNNRHAYLKLSLMFKHSKSK